MKPIARPDCYRCRAFFVTHEPEHPYGCRTFSIKSRFVPALAVRKASGEECRAFESKESAAPRSPGRPDFRNA